MLAGREGKGLYKYFESKRGFIFVELGKMKVVFLVQTMLLFGRSRSVGRSSSRRMMMI